MDNPFGNSVKLAAVESAFLSLVSDRTLRVVYRNIPNSREAAYCFPPVNTILLPRVDKTSLSSEQLRIYTANFYHETRHYFLSDGKEVERSVQHGLIIKDLTNALEDARIELCPLCVLEGGKQDLTEDNIEAAKEYNAKANNQLNNRWGWLIQALFYHLTPYGSLNICDELQPYFETATTILNDGRFQKSVGMGKEGNKIIVDLAIDIAKSWQEKREKEDKNNGRNEKSDNSDSSDGQDGTGKSGGKDGGSGKSDNRNGSDDSNGGEDGKNDNRDEDDEKNPQSPKPNNEDSGRNGKGKRDKPKQSDGNSKPGDGNEQPDSNDRGNREGVNDDSAGDDSSDEKGENGNSGNAEDTSPSDGRNGGKKRSKSRKRNGGKPQPNGDAPSPNQDAGRPEESDSPNNGRDGQKSRQENQKADGNPSEPPRPNSIDEEYAQNNSSKGNPLPKSRSKKVAEMGAEGCEEDFTGTWWMASNNSNKINPNSSRKPGIGDGDPMISYSAKDREVIAKPFPEDFHEIEAKIKQKAVHLQSQLSIILRSLSQCRTQRCMKHGALDSVMYHKIPTGDKYIKKIVTQGIKLDSAVTLLIDLSGSMIGKKAELASQIATLFGEELLNVPHVSFEIRGYNSSPMTNGNFSNGVFSECERMEIINHWIFKKFNENWRNVRYRMGSCAHSMNDAKPDSGGSVGGCNIDHENLRMAAYSLMRQKEKNKVLIVLCDGQPSGYNHTYGGKLLTELHKTIAKIRQAKINLFCFGICTDDVNQFYAPNVETIHNLDGLNEKALRKLAELILQRRSI